MLARADLVRGVATVFVYWSGWLSLISQIANYNIRIALTSRDNVSPSVIVPVFEHDYFAAPSRPFRVHLTPGLYSFILTVTNAGNYSQMAWRLVLVVDDDAVLGRSDLAYMFNVTPSWGGVAALPDCGQLLGRLLL